MKPSASCGALAASGDDLLPKRLDEAAFEPQHLQVAPEVLLPIFSRKLRFQPNAVPPGEAALEVAREELLTGAACPLRRQFSRHPDFPAAEPFRYQPLLGHDVPARQAARGLVLALYR
jgi:hypothetical protein